jgi:prepilin-type N-terminal cleavage/methylation domain-containing protein
MNNNPHQPYQKNKLRRRGFTLLEVVIALGLMGMLVGMIFRVAHSSMQLSQTVVEEQSATMERNAFFNLLKNHFEQIPGNAVLRLESSESRSGSTSRSLFTLTFQNVPMSFNWGETPMTAEAIELATVEQRDGFVDVVLRFYDEQILDDSDSIGNEDIKPVAEITLIEDLWMCDCEVVDGRTLEYLTEWDNSGQLPLQVKFYCRFEPTTDIVQQTFWVIPKQNPEVIFRQIMQQNPEGPQVTPGGGDGTTPPTTNPGQPNTGGGNRPGTSPSSGPTTSPPIPGNSGR